MAKQKVTEEWAKTPTAEIRIACDGCKVPQYIDALLQERRFNKPYNIYLEVLWVCPLCGWTKHGYYLSNLLKEHQRRLRERLSVWNASHDSFDFKVYQKAQAIYQEEFDRLQAEGLLFLKNAEYAGG